MEITINYIHYSEGYSPGITIIHIFDKSCVGML